ncbi:MAG: hypothetical protein ACR2NR_00920 [Solirubrobacteraceae bacterium]
MREPLPVALTARPLGATTPVITPLAAAGPALDTVIVSVNVALSFAAFGPAIETLTTASLATATTV